MSALQGAGGPSQDRFKKAGERPLLLFSAPRLVLKLAVPGGLRAPGAEGAGGILAEPEGRGSHSARVLGTEGPGACGVVPESPRHVVGSWVPCRVAPTW